MVVTLFCVALRRAVQGHKEACHYMMKNKASDNWFEDILRLFDALDFGHTVAVVSVFLQRHIIKQ